MTRLPHAAPGPPRPGPVLPIADRHPARRAGQDRAVQLGVRPAPRRHLRVPDRGHRRRPRLRGVLPGAHRRADLARPGLGRGPEHRRPARARTGRASAARSTARSPPNCWPPGTCTSRTPINDDVTARHLAAGRDPKLGYDNYDRAPDAALIEAAVAAGRPPVLRLRMPDRDITFDDLVRGADHLPGRQRARPGAGPRHRRPAVHAGQPGRRRADGHHPRAARRGPAAVHAAADRAVRGADRHRPGRGGAGVRPPAVRHRGGQPQALQA